MDEHSSNNSTIQTTYVSSPALLISGTSDAAHIREHTGANLPKNFVRGNTESVYKTD